MIYSRIERALNDAIKLHNTGLSANESLIKAASNHELNPETICRVTEAFNIAKTRAYVKLASDPAGVFDTGNKAAVIKGVFGNDIPKTAEAAPQAEHVFREGVTLEFKIKTSEQKTARESTSEMSMEDRVKRAYHAIEEQKRAVSQKRAELVDCRHAFEQAFYRVQEYLSYSDNKEKIAELVADIDYQYGEDKVAENLCNLIVNSVGITVEQIKVAGARQYGHDAFHQIFDDLYDSSSRYSALAPLYNDEARDKQAQIDELQRLVRKSSGIERDDFSATDLIGGPIRAKTASTVEVLPVDLIADFESSLFGSNEKTASAPAAPVSRFLKVGFSIGVMGADVPISVGSTAGQAGVDNGIKDLVSKGYNLRLRGIEPKAKAQHKVNMDQIQRESVLRDLIANDEIISQQDPKSIESAYNTMLALAPSASMVPDIVRSVLRQATAQTIDPHFANQLVELENNMLKSKQEAPQQQQK